MKTASICSVAIRDVIPAILVVCPEHVNRVRSVADCTMVQSLRSCVVSQWQLCQTGVRTTHWGISMKTQTVAFRFAFALAAFLLPAVPYAQDSKTQTPAEF